MNSVVVGYDGSVSIMDIAAAEAWRRRARLVVLGSPPAGLLRRTCTTWSGLPVAAHHDAGHGADPAEQLITASRTASLVVVRRCCDPPRPAARVAITARVAAHSYCPTMVVPPDSPGDGPVLLGLGMSAADEPAIGFAFEEADWRRVPLLAVHVWAGIPAPAVGAVSPFAYDVRRAEAAADQLIADALAGWADKHPDVQVERMPLYDANPAATLLDASGLAGLVVVGQHRHPECSHQLLGPVARALLGHAACPVTVVPR